MRASRCNLKLWLSRDGAWKQVACQSFWGWILPDLSFLSCNIFQAVERSPHTPLTRLAWRDHDTYVIIISVSGIWCAPHSPSILIRALLTYCVVAGLFVVCNAISCSVAVWNLSLAQSVGQNSQYYLLVKYSGKPDLWCWRTVQVDAFLTFLGAFGLIFTFTL